MSDKKDVLCSECIDTRILKCPNCNEDVLYCLNVGELIKDEKDFECNRFKPLKEIKKSS